MRFQDRVVLVTGASRGIGRNVAQAFAAEGARVAVHYRVNQKAAEETLGSLPGGPHLSIQADMADGDAVLKLVDEVVKAMGRIDILVNNAGVYEEHPAHSVDYALWRETWSKTINTNLIGPANLSYAAARHMMEQGGGKIINISSRGAFRGEPDAPAYGASKAGMNAMSQSLAKSLAPHGVYVYVVAPGWIETDMAADHLKGPGGDEIRNQSPLKRVGRPDEIAHMVLCLASEGSEFATGCIVDVNGASYLRT